MPTFYASLPSSMPRKPVSRIHIEYRFFPCVVIIIFRLQHYGIRGNLLIRDEIDHFAEQQRKKKKDRKFLFIAKVASSIHA